MNIYFETKTEDLRCITQEWEGYDVQIKNGVISVAKSAPNEPPDKAMMIPIAKRTLINGEYWWELELWIAPKEPNSRFFQHVVIYAD